MAKVLRILSGAALLTGVNSLADRTTCVHVVTVPTHPENPGRKEPKPKPEHKPPKPHEPPHHHDKGHD